MSFATWMAGNSGRLLRIVAGAAIVVVGLMGIDGTWGTAVAVIGLVPIAAGLVNVCFIAPFLRAPFRGRDAIRASGTKP